MKHTDESRDWLEEPRVVWNGGFSQDYYVGPDNSYLYSKSIDIQTRLKMLRLSPKVNEVESHDGHCLVIYKDSNDTIWYLYDNGMVYSSLGFSSNISGQTSFNGVNCLQFFDKSQDKNFLVYVISFPTTYSVYTIELPTNAVASVVTGQSYSGISARVIPLCTMLTTRFVIGLGNAVYNFFATIVPIALRKPFTFPSGNNVTFMSFASQFLNIYTFTGNLLDGKTVLFKWNGGSFNPDYSFEFAGKKVIGGVCNKQDYLITGTSTAVSDLALGANNNITSLFKSLEQDNRFVLGGDVVTNGLIDHKDGITIVGGSCFDAPGVFMCGQLKPNYPWAVSFMYEPLNGEAVDSVCVVGQSVYFSAGGVIYNSIMFGYNHDTYTTTGSIVSRFITGGTLSRIKKIDAIYMGIELPDATCSVDLRFSSNNGTFQLIKTLDFSMPDIVQNKRIKIYSNEFLNNFQNLYTEGSLELVLHGGDGVTPTIREVIVFYEVTDD